MNESMVKYETPNNKRSPKHSKTPAKEKNNEYQVTVEIQKNEIVKQYLHVTNYLIKITCIRKALEMIKRTKQDRSLDYSLCYKKAHLLANYSHHQYYLLKFPFLGS